MLSRVVDYILVGSPFPYWCLRLIARALELTRDAFKILLAPREPSFDQLVSIETGRFEYNGTGTFTQTAPQPLTGTFNSHIHINFGALTVGGEGSFISLNVSAGINDSTSISEVNYRFLSGLANRENVFKAENFNSRFAQTTATINNLSGIIGNTATTFVIYDDGEGAEGNGSVTSDPRED